MLIESEGNDQACNLSTLYPRSQQIPPTDGLDGGNNLIPAGFRVREAVLEVASPPVHEDARTEILDAHIRPHATCPVNVGARAPRLAEWMCHAAGGGYPQGQARDAATRGWQGLDHAGLKLAFGIACTTTGVICVPIMPCPMSLVPLSHVCEAQNSLWRG